MDRKDIMRDSIDPQAILRAYERNEMTQFEIETAMCELCNRMIRDRNSMFKAHKMIVSACSELSKIKE